MTQIGAAAVPGRADAGVAALQRRAEGGSTILAHRSEGMLAVPDPGPRISRRGHLVGLIEQATRHQVTLVCAPASAGKTVACSAWASARSAVHRIIWLTLEADEDQQWFWACVCAGLRRAGVVPREEMRRLEEEPADTFPLDLALAAALFREPVVLVVDNVHRVTDGSLLSGLGRLIRHAPPAMRFVLAGRREPGLQLARLRAAGALADVTAGDLGSDQPGSSWRSARCGISPGQGVSDGSALR